MVDATTQAQLEEKIFRWRMLLYADFENDVLRATSGIYDKTISGSGDSELDGTYISLDPDLIEVSPVTHNEKGSDTVAVSLNGILSGTEYVEDSSGDNVEDSDGDYVRIRGSALLDMLGYVNRWQGRSAGLWFYLVDQNESQVGSIIPYYTGYMNDMKISGSPRSQKVTLTIENYIVTLAGSSNKTYMMQKEYDSGDNSAAATLGAANGLGGYFASGGGGGGGSGPGGGDNDFRRVRPV